MTAFIAYLRVSTNKQGKSGLGLEAQQDAVVRFLRPEDSILATYIEVESGTKSSNRPQLAMAMAHCRRMKGKLLIAKLDRLSRNVSFIASLMESDVKFAACDLPDADPFRMHIEAAVAENEAARISARTKAALAAAKARGVKLGGYRGIPSTPSTLATERAAQARTAKACDAATALVPMINELQAIGATTAYAIAQLLNAKGVATTRGGKWQAIQVARLMKIVGATVN